MPVCLALRVARSIAVSLATVFALVNGIGANSPFEVVSILIGNRVPSGSLRYFMAPPDERFRFSLAEAPRQFNCSGN